MKFYVFVNIKPVSCSYFLNYTSVNLSLLSSCYFSPSTFYSIPPFAPQLTVVLLLGSIFFLFLAHSHEGCGAPDIGILMSMGSPARTLSFLPSRPSRYSLGASVQGDGGQRVNGMGTKSCYIRMCTYINLYRHS